MPDYHQVILDPKRQFDYDGIIVTSPDEINEVAKESQRPIVYRPHPDFDSTDYYDGILKWIYNRHNTTLYIDELYLLTNGNGGQYPKYLRALYTSGRGLGITIIGCAQRPAWVPLYCMESCENTYAFKVPMPEDRTRMAKVFHPDFVEDVPKYDFRYYNIDKTDKPDKMRLPKELA